MDAKSQGQRPQHRRNASSKTGIWKALVSTNKSRSDEPEVGDTPVRPHTRTQSVPLLPADPPHAAEGCVLGERPFNAQSRLPSDKTPNQGSKSPKKNVDHDGRPKKTKSTTNLSSMFAKLNRSHKDLSIEVQQDKENTTPPVTSHVPTLETPIWAQFATTTGSIVEQQDREESHASRIEREIARYTPQDYCPDKQRNFNGSFDQPALRPTLSSSRPQSGYGLLSSEGIVGAIGRRVSGGRSSSDTRRSGESARSQTKDQGRRVSGDRINAMRQIGADRKTSGSSNEQAPAKERLNIAKRGGRVMAAVAALQGKPKETTMDGAALEDKDVDEAFEAVLAARNIPEPMRQKMRALTLRVKADFVRQDQEQSKTPGVTSTDILPGEVTDTKEAGTTKSSSDEKTRKPEDDSKSSKRSRARSRTFTFSKSDKRSSNSPTKRKRAGSKTRPTSVHMPKGVAIVSPSIPTTPTGSMGRLAGPPAIPLTYIDYLRKTADPVSVEVGRLHKLRILLRNETVTWVTSFVSLGGMVEMVRLLHRTMSIEWREDHEDQVLHEALLCLKALCTAECALVELDKLADDLFPALLGMLFDDEKKGPAEYSTRTIIINVLFQFLASAVPTALESRARRILTYLGEPSKPAEAQPVDFVLGMHVPRPYRLWAREVTHVTKEVFWIFLHQMNVISLPKSTPPILPPPDASSATSAPTPLRPPEITSCPHSTFYRTHFPRPRAPVPAAPYIGGVEWDATSYLTAHLDLLNGLLACLPSADERNAQREALRSSGYEKVMGGTLRMCKEKFYGGVHDALRAWVAAAAEDGWETRFVREGMSEEERGEKALRELKARSPKKTDKRKETGEDKGNGGDGVPRLGNVLSGSTTGGLGMGFDLGGVKVTTEERRSSRNGFNDGNDDNCDDDEGWVG